MEQAINFYSYIQKYLNGPTAEQRVQREIEKSRIAALDHQAAAEYHAKMTEYHEGIIKRLSKFK